MSETLKLIETYLAVYNARDVEALVRCFSEDCVFENFSSGACNLRVEGKDALRKQAIKAVGLFSERKQVINRAIVSGALAAIEVEFTAVLAADLNEKMRAGQRLQLKGVSIFEVAGESIRSLRDYS